MKLTIKRSKWYRGNGEVESMLLNENGKMCCLGFLAIKCNLKKKEIRWQPSPIDVFRDGAQFTSNTFAKLIDEGKYFNSPISVQLMSANDDAYIKGSKRESLIKKLMGKIGVDVRFIE